MRKFLSKVKTFLKSLALVGRLEEMNEENKYLLSEVERINEYLRYEQLGDEDLKGDPKQTRSSFDYQWMDMPDDTSTQNSEEFLAGVTDRVCKLTDLDRDWFKGKRILDMGCGSGRFSYGLLDLGAKVTSADQSEHGLQNVAKICHKFSDNLETKQVNILKWDEEGDYDMVFSFGVLHHTGNTYLAIKNAAKKVRPGGKLFLMLYGPPDSLGTYKGENLSRHLRKKLRHMSFADKKKYLLEHYDKSKAHSLFDAVSPRINDLLTFEEIKELLIKLGFENVHHTEKHKNHRLVADKIK